MRRRNRRSGREILRGIEALEARDLPSIAPGLAGLRPPLPLRPGRPILVQGSAVMGGGSGMEMGEPTPHEQARRKFAAAFKGRYTIGPGRTFDQKSQTFLSAGGTATAFLHGEVLLAVFTPQDPSQPITGTASLFDRDYPQTGNLLILDLQGDPSSERNGRPTHLTWTVNDNSSGTFAGAEGQGTVELSYVPRGKLPPRATGAGLGFVQFRGELNTNGTTNPLRVH
ncbi:MAG: hypothetical protein IRY99_15405 [Isosphaeraceae bacterium]|nr:hypothetical protein [Isosphaeraceae bacterium]